MSDAKTEGWVRLTRKHLGMRVRFASEDSEGVIVLVCPGLFGVRQGMSTYTLSRTIRPLRLWRDGGEGGGDGRD